ncbi:hypothetical protein C0V78_13010 [Novosphingobium sp. TH158]|nr:hypothetical protein C0V78_13010 [Novosphingobium sp. TH158]
MGASDYYRGLFPVQRTLKRGGARNRGDRLSTQLDRRQCERLLNVVATGLASGQHFTRFATIAWQKARVSASDSVKATGAWITLLREWLRKRDANLPWAWVQECGPVLGAHCHALIRIPPDLAPLLKNGLAVMARKVARDFGGMPCAGLFDSEKLPFADNPEHSPAAYEAALWGKVHYMLKCAPAGLESELDMLGRGHKPWGQSCPVKGKRLAVWQGYSGWRVLTP